jgi:hypothetical protein
MNQEISLSTQDFSNLLLSVSKVEESQEVHCHISTLDNESASSCDSFNVYYDSIVKELENSLENTEKFQVDEKKEQGIQGISYESLQEKQIPGILILDESDFYLEKEKQPKLTEIYEILRKNSMKDSKEEKESGKNKSLCDGNLEKKDVLYEKENKSTSCLGHLDIPDKGTLEETKTETFDENFKGKNQTGKIMKISIENSLTRMASLKSNHRNTVKSAGQSACAKCLVF